MGGGPASADVVRSSCIVTFPEATGEEPVPVDAWYLHAVGLPFLRRLARDRVGDAMRIALVLQLAGDAASGKRYVAVSSQLVLRRALEETFDRPERALVLHVVSLERVRGRKKIHVRPEINPNVSPEPVEPLGLVFPTLAADGLMTPTAVVVPTAAPADAGELLRQSSFSFRKSVGAAGSAKALDDGSAPFIEERDYTWRSPSSSDQSTASGSGASSFTDATQSSDASSTASLLGLAGSFTSGSVASPVPEPRPAKSVDSTSDSADDIPMARVVAGGGGAADEADEGAAAIPSDYVVLELQHGAGLPEAPAGAGADADADASASSTFFLSSNWHVQADEMSASMRLEPLPGLSASRSGSLHRPRSSLDESFVLLDRSRSQS